MLEPDTNVYYQDQGHAIHPHEPEEDYEDVPAVPARSERLHMSYLREPEEEYEECPGLSAKSEQLPNSDLLPRITRFLEDVLPKEQLSVVAEKQRLALLEELQGVSVGPQLPPRPQGLPKVNPPATNGISDAFLAHQRELARGTGPPKLTKLTNGHTEPAHEEVEEDLGLYDDVKLVDSQPNSRPVSDLYEPGLYEVPETGSDTQQREPWQGSDSGSGTPYESYDEEDEAEPADQHYVNQHFSTSDKVLLPRVRSKERGEKPSKRQQPLSSLTNVTTTGELYHKGTRGILSTWPRRFCAISDGRLVVYKSATAGRPLLVVPLLGYDCLYQDKEGRRSHVIRISHPGCDTQWFAADVKEITDYWLDYLNAACLGEDPPGSGSGTSSLRTESTQSTQSTHDAQSTSASEGGSGDGVVLPITSVPENTDKKKKKFSDSISSLLNNTFSKKKGEKVRRLTNPQLSDDSAHDPDMDICGLLEVSHSVSSGSRDWALKWCTIKDGRLRVYPDTMTPEPDIDCPLAGIKIDTAGKETKKELSLKLTAEGQEPIYVDAPDSIEHGKWLSHIMKAAICGPGSLPSMAHTRVMAENEADNIYQNQPMVSAVSGNTDEQELIYDVVQERGIPGAHYRPPCESESSTPSVVSGWQDRALPPRPTDSPPSRVIPAPPLPTTGPSKHRLDHLRRTSSSASDRSNSPKVTKRDMATDQDDLEDEYEQQPDVESFVSSTFSSIKSRLDNNSPGGSPSASSRQPNKFHTSSPRGGSTERVPIHTDARDSNDVVDYKLTQAESDVVKCHSGPTIDEDKELLQTTQNPILSSLRQERQHGGLGKEATMVAVDEQRQKVEALRKSKLETRRRIHAARGLAERGRQEVVMADIETRLEGAEQELTRLQLLAQEKEAGQISRNSSFKSTSSAGSAGSPRAARACLGSSRPARGTGSFSNQKNSPLADRKLSGKSLSLERNQTSISTTETNQNVTSAAMIGSRRASGGLEAISASSMAKTWSKPRAVSATTKQAIAKFNATDKTTKTTKTEHLSEKRSLDASDPIRGRGSRGVVTKTTGSQRSTISSSVTNRASNNNLPTTRTSPVNTKSQRLGTKKINGPENDGATRRVVQERLKLWEQISENTSNC